MNRNHAHAPTRLTNGDRERQRAAVARFDRQRAAAKRKQRIARIAYCGILVALVPILFYSIGSY